jgi:hypothetical protein
MTWCVAHLYVVPAKVAGTWRMGDGELQLEQSYQKIYGTYELAGIRLDVDGSLRGNEVQFTVNGVEYTGHIKGDTMSGEARGRASSAWSAQRLN